MIHIFRVEDMQFLIAMEYDAFLLVKNVVDRDPDITHTVVYDLLFETSFELKKDVIWPVEKEHFLLLGPFLRYLGFTRLLTTPTQFLAWRQYD